MKFANVNKERTEAAKGLVGLCIGCAQPMIPKCGEKNAPHWAHKSKIECDKWSEGETPWHRDWKNLFPKNWQEIRHQDENGIFHIADVKTDQGVVVELQNSRISKDERNSRNDFYKKMIWIVNGLRNKGDLAKFENAISGLKPTNLPREIFSIPLNACIILEDWIDCKTPVFLDFGTDEKLWLIYPKVIEENVFVKQIDKALLVQYLQNGQYGLQNFQNILTGFENQLFPPKVLQPTTYVLSRLNTIGVPINHLAYLMGLNGYRPVKRNTRSFSNRRKRF